jgi:oxygen-independent coproporphyrinogen-3 oxidase
MIKDALETLLFDFPLARRLWKPLIKRLVSGSWQPIMLMPNEVHMPRELKKLGLYLHVPFCKNLCPFCPYHRIKYEEGLFSRFERATMQEISLYGARLQEVWGANRPDIVSLYIGGGTPTIVPEVLARIVTHIQAVFGKPHDICVELHPAAMDDHCLNTLKGMGVTMLSVGVQSLNDRLLQLIGRSHDAATAIDAIQRAVSKNFAAVNSDVMFALPTQTLTELDQDIQKLLALGVDQLSTYPIFGFPYTDLGQEQHLKKIKRPRGQLIRQMLALIRQRSQEQGFRQCAVWSFLRPDKKKFSSITRHHYLGFGPSAATMTGKEFYVNTFAVEEYVAALPERLPVSLVMQVNKRLEMTYWLYWRVYEMEIPRADFYQLFGEDLDTVFGRLLSGMKMLGLVDEDATGYHIKEKAAYWVHRLQNEYSLNYLNRLWGKCKEEAWPRQVRL